LEKLLRDVSQRKADKEAELSEKKRNLELQREREEEAKKKATAIKQKVKKEKRPHVLKGMAEKLMSDFSMYETDYTSVLLS
jgi:hypothetical protein